MPSLLNHIFPSRNHAVILMYHRIADEVIDPWDLCVSPKHFDLQLNFLKQSTDVVPVSVLADRIKNKKSIKGLSAITFDDGYLDNYNEAKFYLEKHETPCTFYITLKHLAHDKAFWWDQLESIILKADVLPKQLVLQQPELTFNLGDDFELTTAATGEIASWRYGKDMTNKRLELFLQLWSIMKPMSPTNITNVIQQLQHWSGMASLVSPAIMEAKHVSALASHALIDVGAHTVSHPALGYLSASEQEKEINTCKASLENTVGKTINGFAYPYGNFNHETPGIVKQQGFSYAVSTREQRVSANENLFDLPRFQVKNWNDKEFEKAFKRWQKI